MYNIHQIEARDIPDLWFQAVNDIVDVGRKFKIDRGSYSDQIRIEFDYFIARIKQPWFGSGTPQILPDIPSHLDIPNPVDFDYVYGGPDYSRSYVEYVMTDTMEQNESYTYGQRLTKYPVDIAFMRERTYNIRAYGTSKIVIDDLELWNNSSVIDDSGPQMYVNQIELVIWTYKNKGHRNNQMVLQVAKPDDCLLQDPPCLRSIDTRIQDGKLHFIIYFRSWDLWGGLPANLAGIEALQQYMAAEIGVEQGEFIIESKGLHLYQYAETLAKIRTVKL